MSNGIDLSTTKTCYCLAARALTRLYNSRLRPHGLRATQFSILVALELPLVALEAANLSLREGRKGLPQKNILGSRNRSLGGGSRVSVIGDKLERLRNGWRPRVLDLFGGCGGLSLGFEAAGFEAFGAVDNDPYAAASYAWNFHRRPDGSPDPVHAAPRDIRTVDPLAYVAELDAERPPELAVDVIVGGPPCQAYARVGRAKLRDVKGSPDAYRLDERGYLFHTFLDWVEALRPVVVVMENVPDMLNYGGKNLARTVCERLQSLGYEARYGLLNAVHYGVPQLRERVFVVAISGEAGVVPDLPVPRCRYELPEGYRQIREAVRTRCRGRDPYWVDTTTEPPLPKNAVTAREAIGDLPPVYPSHTPAPRRGRARMDQLWPYPEGVAISRYARLMREWPGHEGKGGVRDHVTRRHPRDYPIFARMAPGAEYPEAHAISESRFKELAAELIASGVPCFPGTEEYERLRRATVLPYDPTKFPNKWWKIDPDRPVRTLTAHLGKDTYSHIHYDDSQARTITVREAARLQSFPDGFRFAGTMNHAFRQIGNAVPPLLAYAVARSIRSQLAAAVRDAFGGVVL